VKSVKTRFIYILVASLTLSLSPLLHAETKYVSDHLVITVRTGEGSEFQVIKTLGSGERVEVLETSDSGYTFVETADGTEGWVRSQYLQPEVTARKKLAGVETQLEKSKAALKKLKKNYTELNKKYKLISQNQAKLSADKTKLDSELARISEVAKRPIILDKQNRKLQHANVNLEKDLQRLSQENHSLKDRSQREWFIVGALVLFGGIILGLVIPKLRTKKRSSW